MLLTNLWYKENKPLIEVHEGHNSKQIQVGSLKGKYISNERFCIGYNKKGKRIPHGIKLKTGIMCKKCKNYDVFLKCTICNGAKCLDKRSWSWCNQPFIVYFAYFGGDLIKVGVTAKRRLNERLTEQGAIAFSIHDEFKNGLLARRCETNLAKKFPDRVKSAKKIELYKKLKLDWFQNKFDNAIIIEKNLKTVKEIKNQKIKKVIKFIPDEQIKTIGQLLILKNVVIPFSSLRGRRIIEKQSIFDF